MTAWALLLLSCSPKGPGAQASSDGNVCPSPVSWYTDADGDGYGAGASTAQSCVRPGTDVANEDDCDDADAGVNPDATERCNGVDDDCDGAVDPGTAADAITCWTDVDGDGNGDPDAPTPACACAGGLADNDDDCDDTLADIHPGAEEVLYDGIDQACDGLAGDYDSDGDGYDWDGAKEVEGTDCDDDDPGVNPGALDLCDDSVDQDCDGRLDECGFDAVNDPLDAWWIVYRDHDIHETGIFGNRFVPAGDTDGDGRQELLTAVVACEDGTGSEADDCHQVVHYDLLEAPAGTSGGQDDIRAVTVASWAWAGDTEHYWTGTAYGLNGPLFPVLANVDLDMDGFTDFLMAAYTERLDDPLDFHASSINLWYGPPRLRHDSRQADGPGDGPDHPAQWKCGSEFRGCAARGCVRSQYLEHRRRHGRLQQHRLRHRPPRRHALRTPALRWRRGPVTGPQHRDGRWLRGRRGSDVQGPGRRWHQRPGHLGAARPV